MKIVQVDVNRYADVEAAVKDTKVVINVVGPYWLWGTNVVRCVRGRLLRVRTRLEPGLRLHRACAEHGKRYVDLAGEPHFMKKIIDG